ncbi:hypothetical protein [Paraburkholderia sp. BL10I2N1]|uniref:hypothetical protein n=1 Tax=Paraburkholderia sp. BL10I2N1 TaxID=1938796 RepID=UPI00105DACBD|nr:hypothetical protein [Paraburkholderia sp. BL10I2N1]TDN69515.1 hypothetical protein B0G77_2914 [Paraburkholderia sp. BL10I2N1]
MSPEPNLPVSPTDLKPTATTPPPKKPHAPDDSSSNSSGSGDALLAALQQTLQQMGIDPDRIQTGSATVTDSGTSQNGSDGTVQSAQAGTARTASQRFLVALYQALVFQHSLSTPVQEGGHTGATDAVSAAYHDLGSSIGRLATTVRATLPDVAATSNEWDWQLDDVTTSSAADATGGSSDSAVTALNDALQAYAAPAAENAGGMVSLADVLDGLSRETKGVKWTPIGLVVDVTI